MSAGLEIKAPVDVADRSRSKSTSIASEPGGSDGAGAIDMEVGSRKVGMMA